MQTWTEVLTTPDLIARAAARWPDKDALVFPDSRETFRQLADAVALVARGLIGLGIKAGDRVGVLLPNMPETVHFLFGIQAAGAIAVPISPRSRVREIQHIVVDAELRAIDLVALLGQSFPSLSEQTNPLELRLIEAPQLRNVLLVGTKDAKFVVKPERFCQVAGTVAPEKSDLRQSQVQLRGIAMMPYTSGTTALQKGCPLSHEAINRTAAEQARHLGLTDKDRAFCPLPMFHMAFYSEMIACVTVGAPMVTVRYFQPSTAVRLLHQEQPTIVFAYFPVIVQGMMNDPGWKAKEFSFRIFTAIGPEKSIRNVQAQLPGVSIIASYGSTEAAGTMALGAPGDPIDIRSTSSGRAFRGIEMTILDDDGKELGPNSRGEIALRGYNMFEGYHNDPAKNAEAWTADGWFRTGDIGIMDAAGRVTYLDRAKDMLKVGGENVAAAEIEGVLSTHPAVQIVQVVAARDDKYEQVPAAFIQLRAGHQASADEMIAHCKGQIASFKWPKHIRFVTEWPMSATKIQKFRLRELIAKELES
jgi:fatty-acyl-CoA synthase